MQPLAPLPDHDADHDQPTGAPAPILLDVTVPRFTGMAGIAVRAILGAVDLSALFEAARVAPVAPTEHCAHTAGARLLNLPVKELGRPRGRRVFEILDKAAPGGERTGCVEQHTLR